MPTANELYKEGRRLQNERQFDEAVAKLQEAAAANPQDTLCLQAMVQCYTEMGLHEEAIRTAQKVVELDGNDFFSYISLSRAYQRAGMIPEAEIAMMQGQQVQMRAQNSAGG